MSQIHLAIAADFTLAEKLLEVLENSNLTFDKVSAVEIEPFGEEQTSVSARKPLSNLN